MAKFQRQKSNVMLMELIIVILFFSIATTITLQVFVLAHQRSNESLRMTYALNEAQDWAEQLSASRNPEALLQETGWKGGEGAYELKSLDDKYTLVLNTSKEQTAAGEMLTARIEVYDDVPADRPLLVSLSVKHYLPGDGGQA